MTGVETRSVARDSLFLLADIRIEQGTDAHRVRVRNLSDGGMMAEGNLKVKRGHRVEVQLRNVGSITGSVAWVQDNRFGIAFDEEIVSQLVRRPVQAEASPPAMMLKASWVHRAPPPPEPSKLRKL
ncbi:MAG: PilZ domain-containing protein [Erythrobacter sp.]